MLTLSDAQARYGKVIKGVWKDEAKWCALLPLPDEVSSRLINSMSGKPTEHIYCNIDIAQSLLAAFKNVEERGCLGELKTFDGCLMVRAQRGSLDGLISTHAYALAIDLNAKENPLGGPCLFSRAFIQCFTDEGFVHGGTFKRIDAMHFQKANW